MKNKKILITGAAGFVGHHLVQYYLNKGYEVIGFVSMRSTGNLHRLLSHSDNPKFKMIYHDLECTIPEQISKQLHDINIILHVAAMPHVDKSIKDPMGTIRSNVLGTTTLLEFARGLPNLEKFLLFSTDEVYGPSINEPYKETSRHNPTNPYSASKSASEMIAYSYFFTYKMPIVITHTMNIFGEGQNSKALIPLAINKVLNEEEFHLHTNEDKIGPSRCYTYIDDVITAIDIVISQSINNFSEVPIYNIGSDSEIYIEDIVKNIANYLNKPIKISKQVGIRNFVDIKYKLSKNKIHSLGWTTSHNFFETLPSVIQWYLDNRQWL